MEIVFLYIEMQLQEQFKYPLIRNRSVDLSGERERVRERECVRRKGQQTDTDREWKSCAMWNGMRCLCFAHATSRFSSSISVITIIEESNKFTSERKTIKQQPLHCYRIPFHSTVYLWVI